MSEANYARKILAVKTPCEGRNAAERAVERAAKSREVGLSRLKDFHVFHLCFVRRVISKQDEDLSHKRKQLEEDSSISYTGTTLKLQFALISFAGKRLQVDGSTLHTATTLNLNLARIGNHVRRNP